MRFKDCRFNIQQQDDVEFIKFHFKKDEACIHFHDDKNLAEVYPWEVAKSSSQQQRRFISVYA